jgi:ketosteroid isomerase-like protein
LAINFTVPSFAQQTADPQTMQQIRAFAAKFDEAINKHDPVAVAALYTQGGVNAFHQTSHGRQNIEKSYAYDFQRWHPYNHITTVNRLNAIGNEVRATGRWSGSASARDTDFPSNSEGYFTWIIVREGDTWKIRKSTFSESQGPSTANSAN